MFTVRLCVTAYSIRSSYTIVLQIETFGDLRLYVCDWKRICGIKVSIHFFVFTNVYRRRLPLSIRWTSGLFVGSNSMNKTSKSLK